MNETLITQAYIREAFNYDPVTGAATWLTRPRHHFNTEHGWKSFNAKLAGKPCGCITDSGGMKTQLRGSQCLLHRLVWLWVHGELPPKLDHVNGNRADNRLSNLRPATNSQNSQNTKKREKASSRLKGVTWRPKWRRWEANICLHGQNYYLGNFGSEQDAHEAYCKKGRELFGEFFNPGC